MEPQSRLPRVSPPGVVQMQCSSRTPPGGSCALLSTADTMVALATALLSAVLYKPEVD